MSATLGRHVILGKPPMPGSCIGSYQGSDNHNDEGCASHLHITVVPCAICRPSATSNQQRLLRQHWPVQQQRHRQHRLQCNAASSVRAEDAMHLIQREGYKILDVRSARDYDERHITKPARSSLNAPVVLNDNSTPNPRFLAEVSGFG